MIGLTVYDLSHQSLVGNDSQRHSIIKVCKDMREELGKILSSSFMMDVAVTTKHFPIEKFKLSGTLVNVISPSDHSKFEFTDYQKCYFYFCLLHAIILLPDQLEMDIYKDLLEKSFAASESLSYFKCTLNFFLSSYLMFGYSVLKGEFPTLEKKYQHSFNSDDDNDSENDNDI